MKGYLNRLKDIAGNSRYFWLFLVTVIVLAKVLDPGMISILLIGFFLTFILQTILLKEKSYLLYILRALFLILILFEFVFGRMHDNKDDGHRVAMGSHVEESDQLGHKAILGCTGEMTYGMIGEDTAYKVYYSFDEYGRRINDPADNVPELSDSNRTKHAIFLGCSFTFGESLDNYQSFPYQFASSTDDYTSYNYGLHGWGPHQLSLLFDEGLNTINDQAVPEDSGICVYTFIDDHLNRVWGGNHYLRYGESSPDVFIAEDGSLLAQKRKKNHLRKAWLYNHSETLKYFNVFLTYPGKEDYYRRYADIVSYMSRKYYELKPDGKFYIAYYMHHATDTTWLEYLNDDIEVIMIEAPEDFETNQAYHNNFDEHPSATLNTYYTNKLLEYIKP